MPCHGKPYEEATGLVRRQSERENAGKRLYGGSPGKQWVRHGEQAQDWLL